ncbi:MAG TPA: hypothetical protein ENK41_01585 [Rhodobacteraceae bacterium]|nr:hypothetical protein [Paracoccaceae bacterium]
MKEQDKETVKPATTRSLKMAISRARLVQAEHSDAIADMREADLARLGLLAEELEPVFADIPGNADQFDCALVPGERPRLWIDMLAYVIMGRDRRNYRFVKSTMTGRTVLHETSELSEMVDHITDYIAHRLIEREKMLDADNTRQARPVAAPEPVATSSSAGSAGGKIMAFVTGMLLGIAGMLAYEWIAEHGWPLV